MLGIQKAWRACRLLRGECPGDSDFALLESACEFDSTVALCRWAELRVKRVASAGLVDTSGGDLLNGCMANAMYAGQFRRTEYRHEMRREGVTGELVPGRAGTLWVRRKRCDLRRSASCQVAELRLASGICGRDERHIKGVGSEIPLRPGWIVVAFCLDSFGGMNVPIEQGVIEAALRVKGKMGMVGVAMRLAKGFVVYEAYSTGEYGGLRSACRVKRDVGAVSGGTSLSSLLKQHMALAFDAFDRAIAAQVEAGEIGLRDLSGGGIARIVERGNLASAVEFAVGRGKSHRTAPVPSTSVDATHRNGRLQHDPAGVGVVLRPNRVSGEASEGELNALVRGGNAELLEVDEAAGLDVNYPAA